MGGNTFGHIFKLTTFGESHGFAIGGVVDGCPANISLDLSKIQHELDRRKPGQSTIVTQRKESDTVKFLSGIFDGKTTGTPIGFVIENENEKSADYTHIEDKFRPSHADFTYQEKYGIRDHKGGGRSSARETACRVVAGAIAKQILAQIGVEITAYTSSVGEITLNQNYQDLNLNQIDSNDIRCPDSDIANQMINLIKSVRKEGDTIGGTISCVIKNTPIGLGNPVFDKLHANLGKAMLSINAVKGFDYGSGFDGTKMKGSEHNDLMKSDGEKVSFETNHSGGIQGGISNGEDIYFNIAFKPVATIMQSQKGVDKNKNNITLEGKGRHDPCVVPRAIPIVESMAALVLLDHYLIQKTTHL